MEKALDLSLIGSDFLDLRGDAFVGGHEVVYVISCAQASNSSDKRSIARVLSDDSEGILYIGKASNIGRLVSLLLSIRDGNDGKNHSFGIRYKAHPEFRLKFPLELLRIQLFSCRDSRLTESQKIGSYVSKFGELPPLNHSQ